MLARQTDDGNRMMEHRWGQRHPAQLPVSFKLQSGQYGVGCVLNFSATGAYLQTELPLRVLTLIDLFIDGYNSRSAHLTGCVTRRDHGGVGLEWENPLRPEFFSRAR